MRDFEPEVEALSLRAYVDGRFDVFVDGQPMYLAPQHQYRLPDYDEDIRPAVEHLRAKMPEQ